jgi:hypothetical protein
VIFDAASEGLDVIIGMLIVGLIFLAVIALGELSNWLGHRRGGGRGAPRRDAPRLLDVAVEVRRRSGRKRLTRP